MQAWEERYYDRKEGLIDGQNLFLLNLVRKNYATVNPVPKSQLHWNSRRTRSGISLK